MLCLPLMRTPEGERVTAPAVGLVISEEVMCADNWVLFYLVDSCPLPTPSFHS